MADAVAKLGKIVVVRQDGGGDAKTLRAALEAATPNGLIEIADSGIYRERIDIRPELEGLILRGAAGCWPVVTSQGAAKGISCLIRVAAPRVVIEHLVLSDLVPTGSGSCIGKPKGGGVTLRSAVVHGNLGGMELRRCVVAGMIGSHSMTDCIQVAGIVESDGGTRRLTNCLVPRVRTITHGGIRLVRCTVFGMANSGTGRGYIADSIVESVDFPGDSSVGPIIHSCVYGKKPFRRHAKPGEGCITADPQFRNPKAFDYRLKPSSPCRGKASDGGDMGCRLTPEMIDLLKRAFDLRKKGVIKF
jgi:hypothetical protein